MTKESAVAGVLVAACLGVAKEESSGDDASVVNMHHS